MMTNDDRILQTTSFVFQTWIKVLWI